VWRYMCLHQNLIQARRCGLDEKAEDEILDLMDDVWYRLSHAEQQEVEKMLAQ